MNKAQTNQPKEFVVGENQNKSDGFVKITDEQRLQIQDAIKKASSMEEIDRLEQLT
eukprot:UN01767